MFQIAIKTILQQLIVIDSRFQLLYCVVQFRANAIGLGIPSDRSVFEVKQIFGVRAKLNHAAKQLKVAVNNDQLLQDSLDHYLKHNESGIQTSASPPPNNFPTH